MVSGEWGALITTLLAIPTRQPSKREEDRLRVRQMIERRRIVTVALVVQELGMQEMKVRRALEEITPGYARAIPGRPARWVKA